MGIGVLGRQDPRVHLEAAQGQVRQVGDDLLVKLRAASLAAGLTFQGGGAVARDELLEVHGHHIPSLG